MTHYARYAATTAGAETPQSQPILGENQVRNRAGGYAYAVSDWERLDRWLILGSADNTYYASGRELTAENANVVVRLLKSDAARVVNRVTEVSERGLAAKNAPALFALALAATFPDQEVRAQALAVLPRVARTSTHLFHFVSYVDAMPGWGRRIRSGIGAWYLGKRPADLAYQVAKYPQRDGWSHRDVLRLAHVKSTAIHGATRHILHYVVKGWESVGDEPHPDEALRTIWAAERVKRVTEPTEVSRLVRDYGLTHEMLPGDAKRSPEVWDALLEKMPLAAMIRNLSKMTRVGLLKPLSEAAKTVEARLGDEAYLHRSRVHPIAVLSALRVYTAGRGVRSQATSFDPVGQVVDALDGAFYATFENVPVTGKRWVLALDVSGSMGNGEIAGVPGLTPREASAALALVTAKREPSTQIIAFTSSGFYPSRGGDGVTAVDITAGMRVDAAVERVSNLRWGGTDCALPMLWALGNRVDADVFAVLTDNETWAGEIHPSQALRRYRAERVADAKLVAVAMTAVEYSVADPDDAGSLNVVGFSTDTPAVMAGFVGGFERGSQPDDESGEGDGGDDS